MWPFNDEKLSALQKFEAIGEQFRPVGEICPICGRAPMVRSASGDLRCPCGHSEKVKE